MTPQQIGPYRISEKLGSGGMGNVYLGEHIETGATAAVKVLTASLAREPGFVERFNREIEAMQKLDNPHIVKLFGSGVDGESYYYAMEHIPGETLLSLMRREKRLAWRRAIDIAIQVCRALKSAHDTGIIHRDLKPSNLLVTNDGFIKLTDFGVAQVFAGGRLTVTGGIIGTAEYMSPEQAQGKRASKQSDLYSLGALLYAMVTGRTPFSGSTAVEVIQKHKFGLFDRPSLFTPELPQRVEETICKLLEKDPAKRFPDAFVLLRHLEQLLRLEDYVSAGVTLADSSLVERDAETVAVTTADASSPAPDRGRHGPATLMQGLIRAEIDEANREHWFTSLFNSLAVQLALLALIAVVGWWLWPRTIPPEKRFELGVALMQEEPNLEWLRARSEYFAPLVAADPETWADQVAPYLKRIELYDLTRGGRSARRGKGAVAESEPLRLLQRAQRYRDEGDSARAERTLRALRALLTGNEGEARTYEFAGQLLEELQQERGDTRIRDQFLADALGRADRLSADGRTAEAREIWQGIVDLYGDDPGVEAAVSRATVALNGGTVKP
jgi:serine/threonine-protein kinase